MLTGSGSVSRLRSGSDSGIESGSGSRSGSGSSKLGHFILIFRAGTVCGQAASLERLNAGREFSCLGSSL